MAKIACWPSSITGLVGFKRDDEHQRPSRCENIAEHRPDRRLIGDDQRRVVGVDIFAQHDMAFVTTTARLY